MGKIKRLHDLYRFPGFVPQAHVRGVFGDPVAVVITLRRREKNGLRRLRACLSHLLRPAASSSARSLLWRQARLSRLPDSPGLVLAVWRREERTAGLAGRQSFLHQAVRLLRGPTLPRKHRQGRGRGTAPRLAHRQGAGQAVHARTTAPCRQPAPTVIGIDEIAIAKGHSYRIVVSDLKRGRPIWFGGQDRSEASMDEFFAWLGPKKCQENPPGGHGHVEGVPQLHPQGGQCSAGHDPVRQVPRPAHLGEAMDKVRKSEYARLSGRGATLHQGPEVHAAVALGEPHPPRGRRR